MKKEIKKENLTDKQILTFAKSGYTKEEFKKRFELSELEYQALLKECESRREISTRFWKNSRCSYNLRPKIYIDSSYIYRYGEVAGLFFYLQKYRVYMSFPQVLCAGHITLKELFEQSSSYERIVCGSEEKASLLRSHGISNAFCFVPVNTPIEFVV